MVKEKKKSKNSSEDSGNQPQVPLTQNNTLIYIEAIRQDINGEEHILTFFKDITFGILYEQIKF